MFSRNMFINFNILVKKCTKNGIRLQKDFSMSDMSASSTNIPWPKSRLDSRYDCALCRLAGGAAGSRPPAAAVQRRFLQSTPVLGLTACDGHVLHKSQYFTVQNRRFQTSLLPACL